MFCAVDFHLILAIQNEKTKVIERLSLAELQHTKNSWMEQLIDFRDPY